MATTPKLYEAACKGTHLSQGGPDDGSDENFVYGGPENADGGNTEAHAPHGEDSLGLWQINIDPAQTDNPDTFDCSEIVQWASGPAVQTGAWVADVTYERAASQLESANNLKQIVLAVHALDAGECSVDICAQNSPSASPAPDNSSRGYTAGHFALELEGHNASMPTFDYGTGSFTIANTANPATVDANLVFDSTGGGGRSTVLLPYIEQHGGEADDGGFVINWTTGDGSKGWDSVGVIAIIAPAEHEGRSVLEFSVENFPNNSPSPAPVEGFGLDRGHMGSSFDLVFPAQTTFPQRDGNAVATESLEIAHEGFLGESDLPAFGYNLGDTAIEATKLPMHPETTISGAPSPHQAVTWTAIAMAESGGSMGSYSDYSLYDLVA
jgi:hypothetical protein